MKKKLKKQNELKFSSSPYNIKIKFLEEVNKHNIEIFTITVNKNNLISKFDEDLSILYNYLISILLEKTLRKLNIDYETEIILDKCMNRHQSKILESYLNTNCFNKFQQLLNIEVIHKNSLDDSALQVIDLIVGAFRYKYNQKSDIYCKIFNRLIIEVIELI